MTQPSFVPIAEADQVRPARRLNVPTAWAADRPGDLRQPRQPKGRTLGSQGPDQGYALSLAHRFEHQLVLAPGELAEDAIVGCALIASKRASLFGRAPSVHDVRFALGLWSFLEPAPADLVAKRTATFSSVSHDYVLQRELVDQIPEEILALTPDEVAETAWRP
jgi:hypothetical protein